MENENVVPYALFEMSRYQYKNFNMSDFVSEKEFLVIGWVTAPRGVMVSPSLKLRSYTLILLVLLFFAICMLMVCFNFFQLNGTMKTSFSKFQKQMKN